MHRRFRKHSRIPWCGSIRRMHIPFRSISLASNSLSPRWLVSFFLQWRTYSVDNASPCRGVKSVLGRIIRPNWARTN